MAKDYLPSLIGLLQHALESKDLVHKQLAGNGLMNLSLGVFGEGLEDELIHLF